MSFWSHSQSAVSTSSKWSEDVAMSSVRTTYSEHQHPPNQLPLTPPMVEALLPIPVVQSSGQRRKNPKSVRISVLSSHWAGIKKQIGSPTGPSTSSVTGESIVESTYTRHGRTEIDEDGRDEVDEVVVDRSWSEDYKSSVTQSDHGADKSGSRNTDHDHESFAVHPKGFWASCTPLVLLRWTVWPFVMDFFSSRFFDEKTEAQFIRESWGLKKRLALWSSVYMVANWVLACIFIPGPIVLADKIFYYAVAPVLTLPLFVMVVLDFPRKYSNIYQVVLCASTWSWSFYQILFVFLCGFYDRHTSHFTCGSKDFLSTFYYTSALQTIALFGMNLKRFPAMIGAVSFLIFSSCLVVSTNFSWTRNIINFIVYQAVLTYMHYQREKSERRLFNLRDQLKIQYKATQKAQVNERKAADSKRRLTSYVRVPLNTALLAVQNMEASGTIAKNQEIEFNALEGSLSMMSKVLNDVLDFNRMDSGKFESASRPYAFHQVMRSLFIPLQLATNARNLELVTDLDMNIDQVARRAAYEAMGEAPAAIAKHLEEQPSGDSAWGMVVGDETRLRQIVTNLASNACKFTPAGGKLTISTRLVLPCRTPDSHHSTQLTQVNTPDAENDHHSLSTNHLSQHNLDHTTLTPLVDRIVVRIEVTDTGWGIRPKDMAQARLFSAFNQTEQGRQQGGKGTGLGLALVRQIVKLSGGRLGVRSKIGEGSTFWVELPLGVGSKTMDISGPPEPGSAGPASSKLETMFDLSGKTVSRSRSSVAEAVDAAAWRASQRSPRSTRSNSALHGLMEQGGRVELVLANYDSHSPIPTRTLGDPSTGTEYRLSGSSPERYHVNDLVPPPLEEAHSSDTLKPSSTELPLPSPNSFETTLSITPSTPASAPLVTSHEPPTSPLFDAGFYVLVVDDDPLTRTLMKRMLTRMGCSVSTAENGEMALEMILGSTESTPSGDSSGPILELSRFTMQGCKYAIVFMDNQMPVLSGLKAVAKLRALGRRDFVVGVTGNALLTDQNEYLEAGVDHVLTKPVLERSLRAMLTLADERRKTSLIREQPT